MSETINPEAFVDSFIEESHEPSTLITTYWYKLDYMFMGRVDPNRELSLDTTGTMNFEYDNNNTLYSLGYVKQSKNGVRMLDERRIGLTIQGGDGGYEAITFSPASGEVKHTPAQSTDELQDEAARQRMASILAFIYNEVKRGEMKAVRA